MERAWDTYVSAHSQLARRVYGSSDPAETPGAAGLSPPFPASPPVGVGLALSFGLGLRDLPRSGYLGHCPTALRHVESTRSCGRTGENMPGPGPPGSGLQPGRFEPALGPEHGLPRAESRRNGNPKRGKNTWSSPGLGAHGVGEYWARTHGTGPSAEFAGKAPGGVRPRSGRPAYERREVRRDAGRPSPGGLAHRSIVSFLKRRRREKQETRSPTTR
jgi:hypothetical protein